VAGVDAWLVHLLFTGDAIDPTTRAHWEKALASVDAQLGLTVRPPWQANVFLAAKDA
jgi:hypothetical protein